MAARRKCDTLIFEGLVTVDGEVVREYMVPSGEGFHRMNWDLRHPVRPGGDPDRWRPYTGEDLPRSVAPQGHFVSPGTYTLTLQARGTTSTTTVEVRGDPEMPMTQAQYEEREAFLSDLKKANKQVAKHHIAKRGKQPTDSVTVRVKDIESNIVRVGMAKFKTCLARLFSFRIRDLNFRAANDVVPV